MSLKPLEIRKHQFARTFRGFDPDEVEGFLGTVAREWETLQDEQRRLEGQIDELRSKIEHYQKVEEALQEALQTARENAIRTHKQAEEKASLIVDQAADKGRRIVEDAESKSAQILDEAGRVRRDAQLASSQTIIQAENERGQVKKEISRLVDHRSELLSRLRGFLLSEMEILARYEEDDPIGFIKLLPPDSTRRRQPAGPVPETSPAEDAPAEVQDMENLEELPAEESPVSIDGLDEHAPEGEMPFELDVDEPGTDENTPREDETEENPADRPWQRSGWRIHEVVSSDRARSEPEPRPPSEEPADDSDEMKKIRRILRDLG